MWLKGPNASVGASPAPSAADVAASAPPAASAAGSPAAAAGSPVAPCGGASSWRRKARASLFETRTRGPTWRDAAEVRPRCGRGAAEVRPRLQPDLVPQHVCAQPLC